MLPPFSHGAWWLPRCRSSGTTERRGSAAQKNRDPATRISEGARHYSPWLPWFTPPLSNKSVTSFLPPLLFLFFRLLHCLMFAFLYLQQDERTGQKRSDGRLVGLMICMSLPFPECSGLTQQRYFSVDMGIEYDQSITAKSLHPCPPVKNFLELKFLGQGSLRGSKGLCFGCCCRCACQFLYQDIERHYKKKRSLFHPLMFKKLEMAVVVTVVQT